MKIYKYETKAGLTDQINEKNVVAYCSSAKSNNVKNIEPKYDDDMALAQNDNQRDLYYIDSILVSTGWNLNDDVFDNAQVWAARTTPEDKQFNFEHDEKQIVGHITKNSSVLFNGEAISSEEMPEDFEILVSTVLYTKWRDPEFSEKIQATIKEIENNEWSVSMEARFSDFDYAVEVTEGETVVIARDEDSSFLTQHLRSYGGTGEFEGHKIGRMLKDITFSGVGLVRKPANPRSVIKESNFQTASVNDVFKQENDDMSDELKAEVEKVEAKLAEANKSIEAKDLVIAELKTAAEAKDSEIKAVSEKLVEANESIAKTEKEIVVSSRRAALVALDIEAEEVETLLAKFENVDDDTFAEILAIKDEAVKAKKDNPFFKKKDDDKDDEKEDKKDVKADIDEAKEEEADDLNVDASAEALAGETIAKASAFFARVLNKTEVKESK